MRVIEPTDVVGTIDPKPKREKRGGLMSFWLGGIGLLLFVALVLFALCAWRAGRAGQRGNWTSVAPMDAITELPLSREHAVASLQMAVRFPTISADDPESVDWTPFERYADFLCERYPAFHAAAERHVVAGHALIYRWPGKESHRRPVVWMAHQDVVPVENASDWTHPPFAGELAEGCLWGRGALDMKSHMIAMLECCEALIAQGYTPARDMYLLLGCDEETGVNTSAIPMREWLKAQDITPLYILDEGTNGFFDGALFDIPRTLACVAVAEKGFGNLRIQVSDDGGHASLPPRKTALGKLMHMAVRMDKRPFPARIAPPVSNMIERLLPEMRWRDRMIYANLWLLRPLAVKKLSANRQTNAWLRSTAALTMASGAPQPNVLPQQAAATWNVRTAPWDQPEQLKQILLARSGFLQGGEQLQGVLVEEQLHAASRVSPSQDGVAKILFDTVEQQFPDCVALPSLMLGGTDAIHLEEICSHIYRFSPFRSYQQYGHTIHATDERVDVEDFLHAIGFFAALCQRADALAE